MSGIKFLREYWWVYCGVLVIVTAGAWLTQ
jgi:hypothetical protein